MSGGTVVPRHECPGGHFFQGDSHASDTGSSLQFMLFMSTVITWKICACVPRRMNSVVGKETVAFSLLVVAIGFRTFEPEHSNCTHQS